MEQVSMPQLGETVVEGTVTRWLKAQGDQVAVDEPLFEVSTDKVDTEVPAAHAGVLRAVLVAEGDTVPVGTVLALIGDASEEVPEPGPAGGAIEGAHPIATVVGSRDRPEGRTLEESPRSGGSAPSGASGRPNLSPVVVRLLDEHGLTSDQVSGSGRDGRITRADVLATAARPTIADRRGSAAPGAEVPRPGPADELLPFSSARRATADHLRRSLDTSAHAFVAIEVDYAAVDPVRRRAGLSYLPFVARAVVDALGEFRHLNASVGDDCLIVHPEVHLGVAVDLEGEALVVPVVRQAGLLRLQALAAAMTGLADRARRRRLGLDEIAGATFTLTNVGAQGTLLAVPIIDQPQVAILSTDGVRARPVARTGPDGEWAVTVHPVGNLSLSFDHRAIDGAYAAAFLARVRTTLEERAWSEEVVDV
jgi:pyruvate dehydrogenase E2 component (dihydrolipoamide acetyltransferase)